MYYVDAGNPGQYTWVRYEHDLTSDIATAFGLGAFSVSAVRLGVLMRKTSDADTRLYWLFDDVELKRGGAVVWHEYREEGSPSWQATPRATSHRGRDACRSDRDPCPPAPPTATGRCSPTRGV